MKLHTQKRLTKEEQEALLAQAKEANKEFTKWVVPAFSKRVIEACSKGWRLDVGVSHYWLENPLGLRVMLSGGIYNNQKWLHLSASRKNRLPGWLEFTKLKDVFLGEETTAIQVFPPKSEYVNLHPYCLHLWSPIKQKNFLPDFRVKSFNGEMVI